MTQQMAIGLLSASDVFFVFNGHGPTMVGLSLESLFLFGAKPAKETNTLRNIRNMQPQY